MNLELPRPAELDDPAWRAIDSCRQRLEKAIADNDQPLVIGSAKELAESTARVILGARGDTVASDEPFLTVLGRAHSALDRQPGQGLASDPTVRNIAQGARSIAAQLPELRNRYGTGHGHSTAPTIADELVLVSVDAALLWCRWALRRLAAMLTGSPAALAKDLLRGAIFKRGTLTERLVAADLPNLDPPEQRLIGVAVAHRAMRDTVVIQEEGVEACAVDPSSSTWPNAYREGVTEGLFLDRDGLIDANRWGVQQAAVILAAHPNPAAVIGELDRKTRAASWSLTFLNDADRREKVVAAMTDVAAVLPTVDAQTAWKNVAAVLNDRAAI